MKKNTTKYYLDNKKVEKMGAEFINTIKEAERYFKDLSDKMGEIRDVYEIDYVIDDIQSMYKKGKLKRISASWLQRRYKIGYVRAARFIDELNMRKIIKPAKNAKDDQSTLWDIK